MNSRGVLRKFISKDAFRVREGCFRKTIQIVSPRGFILNALPVLLLTPGLQGFRWISLDVFGISLDFLGLKTRTPLTRRQVGG